MSRSSQAVDAPESVRPTPQDTNSSLRRALSLLDCFSHGAAELTIRELAQRSGVPRSTTHRLVRELLDWGALEQSTRGVQLGIKLFELGALAPSRSALRAASAPQLHTLRDATGLTANLGVREGNSVVYLDRAESASSPASSVRVGGRGKLHATALGKAILAHAPRHEVQDCLAAGLTPLTDNTTIDTTRLLTEFAAIRRAGSAFDAEESQPGLFCVAAPVRDRRGIAIAAVSLTSAIPLTHADRFANSVIGTARIIERRLAAQTGST